MFCTQKVVINLGIRTNKHPRNGQMDKVMDNFMYKKRRPNSRILAELAFEKWTMDNTRTNPYIYIYFLFLFLNLKL